MAAWSPKVFGNDSALDFVASIDRRKPDGVRAAFKRLLSAALEDESPLVSGVPKREEIGEENLCALVEQLGSIENVLEATGAVAVQGKYWIEDHGVGLAQSALAASALLGMHRSGQIAVEHFGEPSKRTPHLLSALDHKEVPYLLQQAERFCEALEKCENILESWASQISECSDVALILEEIGKVKSALAGRLARGS